MDISIAGSLDKVEHAKVHLIPFNSVSVKRRVKSIQLCGFACLGQGLRGESERPINYYSCPAPSVSHDGPAKVSTYFVESQDEKLGMSNHG
jgi:hypothetical protein